MDIKPRVMLTAANVAERLNISQRTIDNWRSSGTGPPYYKFGSRVLYDEAELSQWIESCRVDARRQSKLVRFRPRR